MTPGARNSNYAGSGDGKGELEREVFEEGLPNSCLDEVFVCTMNKSWIIF